MSQSRLCCRCASSGVGAVSDGEQLRGGKDDGVDIGQRRGCGVGCVGPTDGAGVTHAVPIVEGFSLQHAIVRSDIAGRCSGEGHRVEPYPSRTVTEQLALGLRRAGLAFTSSSELDIVRCIKESVSATTEAVVSCSPPRQTCAVSAAGRPPYAGALRQETAEPYLLPDGRTIQVGSERLNAPEVLFKPNRVGSEDGADRRERAADRQQAACMMWLSGRWSEPTSTFAARCPRRSCLRVATRS